VIPAPSGGWRVVRTFDAGFHMRFVAPGAPLTEAAHEVVGESRRPTWLDGRRLAYVARGAIHVVDAMTGGELSSTPGPEWGELTAITGDGVRWYALQVVGTVTRHLMVNYGDRPGA
jgi:hypothetical protein